jgi:transcriptional regulator with XRE-family HTH domain
MATTDRRIAGVSRKADQMLRAAGDELRLARLSSGLSQRLVGAAIGVSRAEVGRIERSEAPWVTVQVLARFATVVGLALSIRMFPGGPPLRDRGHQALLSAFRSLIHPRLALRTEVPLPIPGDQRAWDGFITGAEIPIGVEAEMSLRDWQRVERRIALKQRDANVDRVILLLADTRSNRAALRAAGPMVAEAFPVSGDRARSALADGRDPGGSSVMFVQVPRVPGVAGM